MHRHVLASANMIHCVNFSLRDDLSLHLVLGVRRPDLVALTLLLAARPHHRLVDLTLLLAAPTTRRLVALSLHLVLAVRRPDRRLVALSLLLAARPHHRLVAGHISLLRLKQVQVIVKSGLQEPDAGVFRMCHSPWTRGCRRFCRLRTCHRQPSRHGRPKASTTKNVEPQMAYNSGQGQFSLPKLTHLPNIPSPNVSLHLKNKQI